MKLKKYREAKEEGEEERSFPKFVSYKNCSHGFFAATSFQNVTQNNQLFCNSVSSPIATAVQSVPFTLTPDERSLSVFNNCWTK